MVIPVLPMLPMTLLNLTAIQAQIQVERDALVEAVVALQVIRKSHDGRCYRNRLERYDGFESRRQAQKTIWNFTIEFGKCSGRHGVS